MKNIIIVISLNLCFSIALWPDSPPMISLNPGTTDISIRIENKSVVNLTSLSLQRTRSLPKGITVSVTDKRIESSSKSTSEEFLSLKITADETLASGVYYIPITVCDTKGHSWNYTLEATLTAEPINYTLMQNYPNPFNTETSIKYSLANTNEQQTVVTIFNLLGQPLRTLVETKQTKGHYSVKWDGKDSFGVLAPSGVYFYQIKSGSFIVSRKLSLLK